MRISSAGRCGLILGCVLTPLFAHAGASISEIMYDLEGSDTDREWIEVENTGSEPLAFGSWKIFEGDTNHGLTLFQGTATTSPGGFVVIVDTPAKFLADWPGFSGTIFDSSFSLSNTGESLALKLQNEIVDQVAYSSATGGAGDGNSLQKKNGSWGAFAPTPGSPASSDGATSPPASPAAATTSPSAPPASSEHQSYVPAKPNITAQAKVPPRGAAGVEATFEAIAYGLKGEPIPNARFIWSFGDGGSAEGKKVLHAYHYPGKYVVLVEASSGEWGSTARGEISVVTPKLSISRVEEGPGGFVELKNEGADELDLSFWILISNNSSFTFPKGTLLPAGRSVLFPGAITKLSATAHTTVVHYPNGMSAVRYTPPSPTTPPRAEPKATIAPVVKPSPSPVSAAPAPPSPPTSTQIKKTVPAALLPEIVSTSTSSTTPVSIELVGAVGGTKPHTLWPWLGGIGGLLLISFVGYVCTLKSPSPPTSAEKLNREADQYAIEEIK